MRRVIKQDRRLAGFGLRAPHRKSYVIGRRPLLEIVEKAELGLDQQAELPEKVILLARPSPQEFADLPAADLLVRCWRLLFHARVHVALDESLAAGRLTAAMVRRRIHAIGPAEFDEIRAVLGQEELLLPPRGDEATYVEFAATYLELRRFAPSFLPRYFPGLENLEAVDALVGEDVDAEGLFQATRPAGAADPRDACELDEWAGLAAEQEPSEADLVPPAEAVSEAKYRFLMRKSQRPASLGNVVRAAICHARAERCAPPELAGRVRLGHPGGRLPPDLPAPSGLAARRGQPGALAGIAVRPGRARRRAASGPSRRGCCTTCRRCAWTTSGTSTRSIWSSGRCRGAAARSSGLCPTSATC